MSKICFLGNWHQFLVFSACFAELGYDVVSVPTSENEVTKLQKGISPVFEPGLEELLKRNINNSRLNFTNDYKLALESAEFAYVSVDVPVAEDDSSDLSPVFVIIDNLLNHISGDLILCLTSQIPIGTSRELSHYINRKCNYKVDVVYIPEFLQLGNAIDTFHNADRVVIGSNSEKVAKKVEKIYSPLDQPILHTDLESAEMIKHASNAFLANSISFINEVANLCEISGADIRPVVKGMKLDSRIGKRAYLGAGLGFAGGTLGRDVHNLQKIGNEFQIKTPIMDAIFEINIDRPNVIVARLKQILSRLRGLTFTIWGLTYKGNTSTLRRAISIQIIEMLLDEGSNIRTYDPLANLNELNQSISFDHFDDLIDSCIETDAIIFLTPWNGIAHVDFKSVANLMNQAIFFDACNYFDPELLESNGFKYFGIGFTEKTTQIEMDHN